MKLLKTLGNPIALVAQGFVLGAALFLATQPESMREFADRTFASATSQAPASSML